MAVNINYKSDFDFILRLKNAGGDEAPFPDCDWEMRFYTDSRADAYMASYKDGIYNNCRPEGDGIRFVFDGHKLRAGKLKYELRVEIPNGIYFDGIQDVYTPQPLDIELVPGAGDCGTTAEVEALLPYIKGDTGPRGPKGDKGDAFTYDDFTPQQIAALQKPATDAADNANVAAQNAATAASNANTAAENIQMELDGKVDKVVGKQLTTNDYANADKDKLDALPTNELLTQTFAGKQDAGTALRKTEQTLTDEERAQVMENLGHPEKAELIAQAEAAGAVYNRNTCFFELNGLTDITDEQMRDILRVSGAYAGSNNSNLIPVNIANNTVRTNFPLYVGPLGLKLFVTGECYEVIAFTVDYDYAGVGLLDWSLSNMPRLKRIIGELTFWPTSHNLSNLPMLEEIRIKNQTSSLSLSNIPRLSKASIEYLVAKATNSKAITITLHPDAYARVTDEIFALAALKQITIATPKST